MQSSKEACYSWLFSELGEKGFAEFIQCAHSIEYAKGDVILRQGAPALGVYIVCEGKVKLVKRAPDGREILLKLLGPREILGEESLIEDRIYEASAKALEPTRVCFVERNDFKVLIEKSPGVALKLIEKLSREIKGYEARLLETAYAHAEARIAHLLLLVAQKFGAASPQGGRYIGVELSRKDLAEMAGVSLRAAIQTLSQLKQRRLITFRNHRIVLLDEEGLQALAGPPLVRVENMI